MAKAQGKDVAGLQDAIVAAQKARLDKAVRDKKLTQSQADDIVGATSRRTSTTSSTPSPATARRRGHPSGGGPRFFFGP